MILLRKFGCQIQQHRKPRVQAKLRKPGENKKTFLLFRACADKSPLCSALIHHESKI